MPSSGDCEVVVERVLLETEALQFDTEMAAPVEMMDANWHRSEQLHRECEWKQGDAAGVDTGRNRNPPPVGRVSAVSDARSKSFLRRRTLEGRSRLPLVGDQQYSWHDQISP